MSSPDLATLRSALGDVAVRRPGGRVVALSESGIRVGGIADSAALGDRVTVLARDGHPVAGQILGFSDGYADVLPEAACAGLAIGNRVIVDGPLAVAPDEGWLGRIVDPCGRPLDGRALMPGPQAYPLHRRPPEATRRRPLGPRLETGLAAFNTFLPLARGQRIGLFAGSGVGKSTLLGNLARGIEADVVVIALVGERGREVRAFVDDVLGPEGLARSVVVAATSDHAALMRRRCAMTAMTVAEHFRDLGRDVLLLADSVTRFAEAHRDLALAVGEAPVRAGHPASMATMITELAERAGPGTDGTGDITAIFSVLVAGSDMEEPVADTLRGVLDGHVVLDRSIAERGRFPAIDLLRSVSRSLPAAATAEENAAMVEARRLLGAYERAELMVQSGLYQSGADPLVDRAIAAWPLLDAFLAEGHGQTIAQSFARLAVCLAAIPNRAGG